MKQLSLINDAPSGRSQRTTETVLVEPVVDVADESELAALAVGLGARKVKGLSDAEKALIEDLPKGQPKKIKALREAIRAGRDPLGDAFCVLRTVEARRSEGAIYTPTRIIASMFSWAQRQRPPRRVVDPGSGSGRFLLEAGRRFSKSQLVGVENDPLAALLSRANLNTAGVATRSRIIVDDFREVELEQVQGRTLYIGNPPYVRHHLIDANWKAWLRSETKAMGLRSSQLAGLHLYFFVAIARRATIGDYGALITAAEWLDVNYGQLQRDLFLDRLGGESIFLIDPKATPFPDTATTAAITTFMIGAEPSSARVTKVSRIDDLNDLSKGRRVRRERLRNTPRWSELTRTPRKRRAGYVELGELCRVHRGQVTGANKVWIAGEEAEGLPSSVLFPAITRARELFDAGWAIEDDSELRRIVDLPADLSSLPKKQRARVETFVAWAQRQGAHKGYVARHRKAWWAVGLRPPAPILATYMARRPPAFVRNVACVRHINIAHGLYPRDELEPQLLDELVRFLRKTTSMSGGRVYAGGLTKFEPKEMERIAVPEPALLREEAKKRKKSR